MLEQQVIEVAVQRMNGSAGSQDVGTRARARNCGRSFVKEGRGEVDRPPL